MTRLISAALAAFALAAPAAAEPALWRLSDADTQMTLFGSVHVLPEDSGWDSDAVMDAFEGADLLVMETSLAPEAQTEAGLLSEREGYLPSGGSLTDMLDPAGRALLPTAAERAGLTVPALEPLRPWMASLVLGLGFARQNGQDAAAGVDTVLFQRARREGRPLAFLETPLQQIEIFANLSPEGEMAMLTATLEEIAQSPDMLHDMDAAWLSGDVEALAELAVTPMVEDTPELYEAALVRRNRAWADALAEMMTEETGAILVVVGAGHLAGPDSLSRLLEDRGFAVERIR